MLGVETGLVPELGPELVHGHELVPEPEPEPEPEPGLELGLELELVLEPGLVLAPVLEPVLELELAPGLGLVTEQLVGHRVADGHHLAIGFLLDAVQIVDASPAQLPVVASLRDLVVASARALFWPFPRADCGYFRGF